MNKNINKEILGAMSKEQKELYKSYIENIDWDLSNIRYLMLYSIEQKDNNVISTIEQYLVERFDLDNLEQINHLLLPDLIEEHEELFQSELVLMHETINLVETFAEHVCLDESDDIKEDVVNFLDSLADLQSYTNDFSDFVLNFCSIQYLRRKTPSKKIEKIVKEKNISYDFQSIHTIMRVHNEFTTIFKKLARLVMAYDNKDYDDEIDVSLYDSKTIAKLVANDGMNNISAELINLLSEYDCDFDSYDVTINSISMYSAIFSKAIKNSSYTIDLKAYTRDYFIFLLSPIQKDFDVDSLSCYKYLYDSFEEYCEALDDDEELHSKNNQESLFNVFKKNVCEIDFDVFKYWYAKTLGYINKIIDK